MALALEYEAVCNRPEHQLAAALSQQQVNDFVNGTIALAEPAVILTCGARSCAIRMMKWYWKSL